MDRKLAVALVLCGLGLAVAWLAAPREPRPAPAEPILATFAPNAERPGPLSGTGPVR